jgi:hypothetical protein
MEGKKPYTKHFHLIYGWRKEKHIPNIFICDMDGGKKNIYQTFSFVIWMEERKKYTKHYHWRYEWRREKHRTNINNDNVWFFFPPSISQMKMFCICISFLQPYLK